MQQYIPLESIVAAALERLAEENAASAQGARVRGDKEEAKFFQRAANAYVKALGFWQEGLRPMPTPNGYLLPSQRPGEAPHKLTKDGDWLCTCPAAESMHWAKALIVGMEVAQDAADSYDDAAEEEEEEDDSIQYENVPYPHGIGNPGWEPEEEEEAGSARTLGQRLAAARARMAA